MRKFLSLFTVLMLVGALVFAQNRVVTGRVTDEKGNAVSFATVTETGSKNAVIADANGNYSLKLKGTSGITVSATGYETAFTNVSGNTAFVSLKRGSGELQEVVVTALGIQRQRKDLGYSTAKVASAELTQSSPVNVANGLQGKVSGLNITSTDNGVFENVKINLRGIRSLTGNNNPLLLLDGVQTPLGFLSSINPQDIQDVTILKGSSSAGIYGPDARNGVIVVTTKKGGSSGKPKITLSHTTQFSKISFFPQFQNEFGSGDPLGNSTPGTVFVPYENWSWGPAYDGTMMPLGNPLKDGTQQMAKYSPNNDRKEFFNTGLTNQTDLSYGVKDFYLSLQDAKINGIVPDDKNRRTSIRLNTGREYEKFKVGFDINYVQQNYNVFDDAAMSDYNTSHNIGLNDGLLNLIFNTPGWVPLKSYKDIYSDPYASYDGFFNLYGMNPYAAIDNWRNSGRIENVLTNLDLNYKFSQAFGVTWRLGGSFSNSSSENTSKGQVATAQSVNGSTSIPGSVDEAFSRTGRLSSEVFATFNKTVGSFRFNVIAGQYFRQSDAKANSVGNSSTALPELYTVGNRIGDLVGGSSISKSRLMSFYGSVGIGFKGWANVELTGRSDKTSVLDINHNTFFYPGVSASLVLSDAIPAIKAGNVFSYLKLRASANKAGNADIAPYSLQSTFSQPANFPYGSLPGFTADNVSYNPLLKPEFIKSTEFGIEIGFLKNRINAEAVYYHQDNTDQIIPVALSSATGYTTAYVNAASFVNRGLEFDLKLTPLIKIGKLKVDFKANASYNTSTVNSIYPGLDRLFAGGYTTAGNYAIVDKPAFVFLSSDYVRDDQGRIIVDRTTGEPTADPDAKEFGRTMPLWTLGFTPTVSYKGLSLSVVAEYKGGNYAYSQIASAMAWTGVSKITATNHRQPFILPNSVVESPAGSGKYVENTTSPIEDPASFFTGVYRDVNSNFLFSADSWRIREVSLSYEFPASALGTQKLVKGLSVSINARNLFLWVPKSNQYTDPDFNFTNGNTSGVTTSQINPATRTMGINVTATF